MIYLSGASARSTLLRQNQHGIGLIITPAHRYNNEWAQAVPCWAADNGCYAQGARFNVDAWLTWLDRMTPSRGTCLFAAVPDVVGNAARTLDRWALLSERVRATGYPIAFVGQDGQEQLPVPWDQLDALFIGGTTDWKLSRHAAALAAEAKRRDKWVHMGRVNSSRRLVYAKKINCDSADGTHVAFEPDLAMKRLNHWLRRANAPQLRLAFEEGP
jgi:hypothetical protein